MATAGRQKGRDVPPPAPVKEAIEVDFGEMLFGDLLLFQSTKADDPLTPELIEALDRVVAGGIKHRKLKESQAIMAAISAKAAEMANPKN